jgi:hypothetical protein
MAAVADSEVGNSTSSTPGRVWVLTGSPLEQPLDRGGVAGTHRPHLHGGAVPQHDIDLSMPRIGGHRGHSLHQEASMYSSHRP